MVGHRSPKLEPGKAQQILNEVLKGNNLDESTVPLEVIESYSNYRKERFLVQRGVALLMLTLFLLMPGLFLMPRAGMAPQPDAEAGRPAFALTVGRNRMVRNVMASIDGADMPVYEYGNGGYIIRPTRNGEMTVVVTLVNDQSEQFTAFVDGVDLEAPVLVSSTTGEGIIRLRLFDNISGVDYSGIYAEAVRDGGSLHLEPLAVDEETGTVTLPFTDSAITVFVPDRVGNRLQLMLSAQGS